MDVAWLLEALRQHWFWLLITAACVTWYSTITIYVAIRGVFDIKNMLARLKSNQDNDPA